MKTCCKCQIPKEPVEFCRCKNNKDGLNYTCRQCASNKYFANREIIRVRAKIYREKTKDATKDKRQAYFAAHRQDKAEYDKAYRQRNKEIIAAYKRVWQDKNKDNPLYKIRRNLRRRIHHAVVNGYRSDHTMNLLGCSIDEFMAYLESKWQPGMTWSNYGLGGWHIDHEIPCSAFNLFLAEDQRKCFHHTNMRPLWEKDNLKKSYIYNGVNCRLTKNKERIEKPTLCTSANINANANLDKRITPTPCTV